MNYIQTGCSSRHSPLNLYGGSGFTMVQGQEATIEFSPGYWKEKT